MHCRLSNISPEGTWVESESFVVAGELVTREAGGSVPPYMMRKWRNLRQSDPQLLTGMDVWQQPSAFVDAVIFQWMQVKEAAEFKQLIRQVDMFAGGFAVFVT